MTDPVPPPRPPGTTRREVKKPTADPEPPQLKKPPGQTTIRGKNIKVPPAPTAREQTGLIRKDPPTPHQGPDKTGSSARIRMPATSITRAAHRETVPAEGADATRQHRRPESALKGMSLRLKIMLSMGAVTLISAALIFIVVFNKASKAMDDEINARGMRILDVVSSIDPSYWRTALYAMNRSQVFEQFLEGIGDPAEKVGDARAKPANKQRHEILVEPFGSISRTTEMDLLISDLTRNPKWKEKVQASPRLTEQYNTLVHPFRSLNDLHPFEKLKGMSSDLVDIGVFDITDEKNTPQVPAYLKDGRANLTFSADVRDLPFAWKDSPFTDGSGRRTVNRMYVKNPADDDPAKLRFAVWLSLKAIEEERAALRALILLPILLSVAIALVIAWAVSQRITQPVKVLIEDINEVSSGNLEHQTQAHSKDEIGVLADTFNRMTVALRAAREQELDAKAMEHELGIAAEIQANLVPKKMLKVPGYEVNAYYRPSKEVGGDYYDFIEIDPTHSGIIVADVSGKGVPGSLVMSMTRAFIRMEAERSHNTSTAATMVSTNKMLAQDIKKGMFVTAIYAILDHATNKICVSSAGHNPMIIWRAASNLIELVNPKGIALGFDRGPVFERTITEEQIQLEKGDRVVMYTDGSVEAMNEEDEEFGDDPFFDLCRKNATLDSAQFLQLLMKALDEHKGDAPQHDDLTIVTFRFLP